MMKTIDLSELNLEELLFLYSELHKLVLPKRNTETRMISIKPGAVGVKT